MTTQYAPASKPTLYFIGVSTSQSSIMKVFPAWADLLGIGTAVIKGIDFPPRTAAADYREAVAFIKQDPLSMGALVTTHKIDLFAGCRDMFEQIDPLASLMGEVSCLSKREGQLVAHAKDPITAGRAIDGLLGEGYFERTASDVLCIGAGGAAIALTWHLLREQAGDNRPARLFVSDRDEHRLAEIESILGSLASTVDCHYQLVQSAEENDQIMGRLSAGSVIINATGLGKDAPGSPITDAAEFPEKAVAWDFNYRGDLIFLDQARHQAAAKQLDVHDGWTYFIHGWFEAISEVFDLKMTCTPELVERLTEAALKATGAASR